MFGQAVKLLDRDIDRYLAVKERDEAVKERDQAVKKRDQAFKERDQAVNEGDLAVKDWFLAVMESAWMLVASNFFLMFGQSARASVRRSRTIVPQGLADKERYLPFWDLANKEKDQAVKEWDLPVKERDQAVNEGDLAVKERDLPVKERDQAVNEGDLAVKERDLAVKERDQAVKDRDLAVKEKDQAVKDRDLAVKERDLAVNGRDQAVKDRDLAVNGRDQAVKDRDLAVNGRDQAVKDRDLAVNGRDQAVKDRDLAVKERDRTKVENERLKKVLFSNNVLPAYQMSHSPKGVCLIINNINFRELPSRTEAEADTDRLANVFRGFDFKVVTLKDLDHSKLVDVMMKQGEADHSGYDCFVCCIMSHGTTGKVFSSNDVGIDILELIKPLNAKRCTSLKGKPKLFFIQACQGERHQSPERTDSVFDVAVTSTFIAKEADIFYGLATVPGYVAIRHDYGAPYVHHLACTLTKYGKTHDLLTMMTMVNDNMNASEQGRLVSSHHSTLRKKVYLCGTV